MPWNHSSIVSNAWFYVKIIAFQVIASVDPDLGPLTRHTLMMINEWVNFRNLVIKARARRRRQRFILQGAIFTIRPNSYEKSACMLHALPLDLCLSSSPWTRGFSRSHPRGSCNPEGGRLCIVSDAHQPTHLPTYLLETRDARKPGDFRHECLCNQRVLAALRRRQR